MLDRQGLHLRAALFASIRQFFSTRGFLEVDTPIRQPVIIPESNILPLAAEGQYLQTSPELCMKRILASGCDNIFQICPCFRKEERGRYHLEEFTMLEWYRSGADYLQLMIDCEELLVEIARAMVMRFPGPAKFSKGGVFPGINLVVPWERLTVEEAFSRYCPLSLEQCIAGNCFDEMLVEYVEPKLGIPSPTFLYDYPVEMASLARCRESDPTKVERFELYLNGIELANGFSELTDVEEQRRRFIREVGNIAMSGRDSAGIPERFLDDLGKIEAAAGIALGMDRLFMLLTGEKEISRAVSFAPGDF
jgi:lysyl-tRNA synthetase class 2